MKNSKIKQKYIFYIDAKIQLLNTEQQKELLRSWINTYYLGTTKVNKMKNGKMVPRFPGKETPEFTDAHYAINSIHNLQLKIGFNLNGQIVDIKYE